MIYFVMFCNPFRLNRATKYIPEEDEISMGRVSTVAAPKYQEREAMREYYT